MISLVIETGIDIHGDMMSLTKKWRGKITVGMFLGIGKLKERDSDVSIIRVEGNT